MVIKVFICKEEDGYIVACYPAPRSRWSQGKTIEGVLANFREAIAVNLYRGMSF